MERHLSDRKTGKIDDVHPQVYHLKFGVKIGLVDPEIIDL